MEIKDKLMKTLLELVAAPSISGTEAENLAAYKIVEIIKEIPYFKNNPHNLHMIKVKGDPLERHFVSAMFCSKRLSKNTVIITGHLDVVDIDDFGHLKELAFNPTELMKRIKELPLNSEAMDDYTSGEWIFGRGTADMKYGLALGIELLRELSERDDFEGNILFLAVPGEESNSEGMLAAVPYLVEQKKTFGYEYKALFVTENSIPKEIGDNKKKIYLGTSGKVMPLFLFVGKETHVYESHTGLNPNLLFSELNRLIELNPDFCESDRGNVTPPPICLKQMDLKELYSVQTPLLAAAYYNILTLNLSIDELIGKLKKISLTAFESTLKIVEENVKKYNAVSCSDNKREKIFPKVIMFKDIYDEVANIQGQALEIFLDEKIKEWQKEKKDLQTIAINIMKETYERYPHKSPAIIIGFAPPYYPNKHLNERIDEDRVLLNIIEEVVDYSKADFHIDIELDNYYMGLCDLSYTGVEDKDSLEKITSNIIGIDRYYHIPVKELEELSIPSVVFGGFGKDFHKYSERLYLPYSMEVVPKLYEKTLYKIFNHYKNI
jgi:arginine utilization protein RocB